MNSYKIFCDSEKLKAELRSKSEAYAKTPAKPAQEIRNSVYRDWVNKKLAEHRLEELLLTYVDKVIAKITGYLARLKAVNKFKLTEEIGKLTTNEESRLKLTPDNADSGLAKLVLTLIELIRKLVEKQAMRRVDDDY